MVMIRLLYAISLSVLIAVILAHGVSYSDGLPDTNMTAAINIEVAD